MAWNLSIYLDRYVARDSISTSIEIPARTLRSRGAGRYSARRGCHRRVDDMAAQQQLFSAVHPITDMERRRAKIMIYAQNA